MLIYGVVLHFKQQSGGATLVDHLLAALLPIGLRVLMQ